MLLYDRRDNRLEPTDGYFASIGNDFAASGSVLQYIRSKANFGYYYSVAPEWVLSFTGEVGHIFGWGGQQVLLQDRSSSVATICVASRRPASAPATRFSGDALGRQQYLRRLDRAGAYLWGSQGTRAQRAVFTDFGSLWSNDQEKITLTRRSWLRLAGSRRHRDSSAIRATAGVGLSWKSRLARFVLTWRRR